MGFEAAAGAASPRVRERTGLRARLAALSLSWAALTGVTAAVIYLLFLPGVARHWRATGDEPHYLLAAHSWVADGDADLSNNYANLDYLNFYFSRDITPQVRLDSAGRQILNHAPALSLLLAPAYALGGRLGALLAQTLLAGLLAALMARLAEHVSGSTPAAVLAALLLAVTPPLVAYPYLAYPELIAALLSTWVVWLLLSRSELSGNESPAALAGLLLALALLPWLNRRFVPLALILTALAAWRWRSRPAVSLATLLVVALSAAGFAAYNSQFLAPPRADIVLPPSSLDFWGRLLRGAGWLLDSQRGLFVFGPLYILVLWGLPGLFRQNPWRWIVLLPVGLSLALVTLAGGFWVAWEFGPRFLVVGLPPLAAPLALAFRDFGRRRWWLALAVLLVAASLFNSWMFLRQPELAYKSSLPLWVEKRLGLPASQLVPQLGGFARVSPTAGDPPALARGGELAFIPAGAPRQIVDAAPLPDLSLGDYRLRWALAVPAGLPPDTELARLTLKHLGGGLVFNRVLTAADLPAGGAAGVVELPFTNTRPDRWRTPLVLNVTASGAVPLRVGPVLVQPAAFRSLVLPWLLLALLAAAAIPAWRNFSPQPAQPAAGPGRWSWPAAILLLLVAGGFVVWAQNRPARVYSAVDLSHFVGRAVPDAEAAAGEAWQVNPATDPPQKAVYGPFQIFDPGSYRAVFRVKLPQPADPALEVARLQVSGAAGPEPLRTQTLRAGHFNRPGVYHQLVLPFTNPRRQALSFELLYPGAAPLQIDSVTVMNDE